MPAEVGAQVAPEGAGPFDLAEAAAAELVRRAGGAPELAVVLGSGWRPAADALGPTDAEWPVAELPGFVPTTVPGHKGALRSLRVGGRRVLVLLGRSHLYEGRSPAQVVHGVRTAAIAGAGVVVLTNAAGGLDPALRPGQVVLIRDHLNLTGASPLSGPLAGPLSGGEPPGRYPSRFVDLTDLYSSRLRSAAKAVDPALAEGVYAALAGPHYETPAEIAMLRAAGAQLVGMSTALEAIAAHHLGASVLGLSLVTNLAAGVSPVPLDHAEVLAAGEAAAPRLGQLLAALVPRL
ncbi:MAG: purine-nucleoside phosphorylase [Acidimicrobiales bacterium]